MSALQQNTPEWLEYRKNKIGASDASVIMGISPWNNPYDLWQEKVGLKKGQALTMAMMRGREMEEPARAKFKALTGISTTPCVVDHQTIDFLMASLDGISEDGKVIVELKAPNEKVHEMAREKKLPKYYYAQVQHQLEVTGLDMAYYMTYRNLEGNIVEVKRDQAFIDEMLEKEADFHRRVVEFDAPEPNHLVVENEILRQAAFEYKEAIRLKKEAEAKEKKAKEIILKTSNGQCIQGCGLKVTHFSQKGTIDYSSIPELKLLDLESYRKAPSNRTKISFVA